MIQPEAIKKKAQRQFTSYLKAWVEEAPFFPLSIPADKKIPERFDVFKNELQQLLQASKEHKKKGYTVELTRTQHRRHGPQDIPTSIRFDTEEDFLYFIGKQREAEQFKHSVKNLLHHFPALKSWVLNAPLKMIEYAEQWPDIIKVLLYYQDNPRPQLYLRELPLVISTKFIETNTGIFEALFKHLFSEAMDSESKDFIGRWGFRHKPGPFFRIRILDPDLRPWLCGFEELSLSLQQLETTHLPGQRLLIVENEMTYLSLPPLPETLAIWGHGNQAQSLRHLSWLQQYQVYYWGDLDTQGLRILAGLRQSHPKIQSFLMDWDTLEAHRPWVQTGVQDVQPPPKGLTLTEAKVFDNLQTHTSRLEQEHISHQTVLKHLTQIFENISPLT